MTVMTQIILAVALVLSIIVPFGYYFIAALNHDLSVSAIIDPHEKIKALLERTGQAR